MLANEIPPTMSQEVQADTVVTPIDVQAQDVCEKEIIDILKSVKDNRNADMMDGDKDGSDMTAAENYGPRRSTRVRKGVSLSEYVHNVWIKKANMKFESLVTSTSVLLELKQMEEQEVWRHITRSEWDEIRYTEATRVVLPSSLFLKAKFDANHEFEKLLKARLVACGNYAEVMDCMGKSFNESPTINLTIVMIVLSICARLRLKKQEYLTWQEHISMQS